MIDRSIVTICLMDKDRVLYESDYELSADILVEDLKKALITALQKDVRDLMTGVSTIRIFNCNPETELADDQTLASAGIWDGGKLVIRRQ